MQAIGKKYSFLKTLDPSVRFGQFFKGGSWDEAALDAAVAAAEAKRGAGKEQSLPALAKGCSLASPSPGTNPSSNGPGVVVPQQPSPGGVVNGGPPPQASPKPRHQDEPADPAVVLSSNVPPEVAPPPTSVAAELAAAFGPPTSVTPLDDAAGLPPIPPPSLLQQQAAIQHAILAMQQSLLAQGIQLPPEMMQMPGGIAESSDHTVGRTENGGGAHHVPAGGAGTQHQLGGASTPAAPKVLGSVGAAMLKRQLGGEEATIQEDLGCTGGEDIAGPIAVSPAVGTAMSQSARDQLRMRMQQRFGGAAQTQQPQQPPSDVVEAAPAPVRIGKEVPRIWLQKASPDLRPAAAQPPNGPPREQQWPSMTAAAAPSEDRWESDDSSDHVESSDVVEPAAYVIVFSAICTVWE